MWNAGSFGIPASRQVPVEEACHSRADAEGARFELVLDWTAESGLRLAREERTIVFSSTAYGHIVDVRTGLTACYGDVEFAQTKEAGLCMRVPPEWETPNGGTLMDASGRTGEQEIFDQESDWIDVSGEGPEGVLAGITLMPHKDCPRVPWMVRDYGLHVYNPWRHSQISVAAQGTYELGVRYIAHDGRASVEEIAGWYEDCP
jgi:hypothetical protein